MFPSGLRPRANSVLLVPGMVMNTSTITKPQRIMASVPSSYNPREIDNTGEIPGRRAPLITGNQTYTSVTDMVCRVAEDPQPRIWWILFGMSSTTALMFLSLIGFLIYKGVGIWGNMNPVFWAWPIVNFGVKAVNK